MGFNQDILPRENNDTIHVPDFNNYELSGPLFTFRHDNLRILCLFFFFLIILFLLQLM